MKSPYQALVWCDAKMIAFFQAVYNLCLDLSGIRLGSFRMLLCALPLAFEMAVIVPLSVRPLMWFPAEIFVFLLGGLLFIWFGRPAIRIIENVLQDRGHYGVINKQSAIEAAWMAHRLLISAVYLYLEYDVPSMTMVLIAPLSYYARCIMVRERNWDRFKTPRLLASAAA